VLRRLHTYCAGLNVLYAEKISPAVTKFASGCSSGGMCFASPALRKTLHMIERSPGLNCMDQESKAGGKELKTNRARSRFRKVSQEREPECGISRDKEGAWTAEGLPNLPMAAVPRCFEYGRVGFALKTAHAWLCFEDRACTQHPYSQTLFVKHGSTC